MTPTNSSPNVLLFKQPANNNNNNKLARQSSTASTTNRRNQYIAHQRRENMVAATSNDLLPQHTPSKFSVPLLAGAMGEFFQATKVMEDEIMLPSRLKDMPVDGNSSSSVHSFLSPLSF